MIYDKITNLHKYTSLNKGIALIIDFLKNNDLSKMEVGKYFIDGEKLFFMISEYETKDLNDCRVEAHRKYIDLQYIIEGDELIGFKLLENQELTEQYSETNDIAFYKAENLFYIEMNPSNFTLLFPEDLHQPCVKYKEKIFNKKVVFKILK